MVRFCSRCGSLASPEDEDRPAARVCTSCGMGVYLACAPDARGTLGTFFLVVARDMRITAVSEGAETIFGDEETLVGRTATAVLTSPIGDERLGRTIRRAAAGVRDGAAVPISAPGLGPLEAHISPCGPPRAALVAIDPAVDEGSG